MMRWFARDVFAPNLPGIGFEARAATKQAFASLGP